MTPEEQAQVVKGFQALGVSPADLQAVLHQPDFDKCQEKLAELKERVRKSFKRLALQLHPDVNGGAAEKTELFKVICRIRDDIEKLTVTPRPQPVPVAPRPPAPIPVVHVIQVTFHPMRGVPGFGHPPPEHPAANGKLRNWRPPPKDRAAATIALHPNGVYPRRGT